MAACVREASDCRVIVSTSAMIARKLSPRIATASSFATDSLGLAPRTSTACAQTTPTDMGAI